GLPPRRSQLIVGVPLMRASRSVSGPAVAALVSAEPLDLRPGTIALFGAAILMLVHNFAHHREREKQTVGVTETFNEVDWITIFFFLGLFVIVHGIDVAGVLALAAQRLIGLTGDNLAAAA